MAPPVIPNCCPADALRARLESLQEAFLAMSDADREANLECIKARFDGIQADVDEEATRLKSASGLFLELPFYREEIALDRTAKPEETITRIDLDKIPKGNCCDICFEDFCDLPEHYPVKFGACGHVFAPTCIAHFWKDKTSFSCPMCRNLFTKERANAWFPEWIAERKAKEQAVVGAALLPDPYDIVFFPRRLAIDWNAESHVPGISADLLRRRLIEEEVFLGGATNHYVPRLRTLVRAGDYLAEAISQLHRDHFDTVEEIQTRGNEMHRFLTDHALVDEAYIQLRLRGETLKERYRYLNRFRRNMEASPTSVSPVLTPQTSEDDTRQRAWRRESLTLRHAAQCVDLRRLALENRRQVISGGIDLFQTRCELNSPEALRAECDEVRRLASARERVDADLTRLHANAIAIERKRAEVRATLTTIEHFE